MPLALRGQARLATKASIASFVLTATQESPVTGDYRVMCIATTGQSVTTPSGWTLLTSTSLWIYVFGQVANTAAASTTFTFGGSNQADWQLATFSNPDATTPIDVTGSTAASSNIAPSLTPATADTMLVCFWGSSSGSGTVSVTTAAGMTALTNTSGTTGNRIVGGAYLPVTGTSATGTKTGTWAGTSTNQYSSSVLLRSAASPSVTLAKSQPRSKARFRASLW